MKTRTAFAILTLAALGATAVYAEKGIKDADMSGDGFVSLDEFKSAHNARIEEHFARMDANADGLLSADEMQAAKQAHRGDRRHGRRNPEEKFNRLDADGNGSVSLQELEGKRFSPDAGTFQAADVDGSGELDASELRAMMKSRAAERRAERLSQDD